MGLFPYKVAIFDLDETLQSGGILGPHTKSILYALHSYNIPIHIASFNLMADRVCEILEISQYITSIEYGRKHTKAEMIDRILTKHHPEIDQLQVVFFDDNEKNIKNVNSSLKVKTVLVTEDHIKWNDVLLV